MKWLGDLQVTCDVFSAMNKKTKVVLDRYENKLIYMILVEVLFSQPMQMECPTFPKEIM